MDMDKIIMDIVISRLEPTFIIMDIINKQLKVTMAIILQQLMVIIKLIFQQQQFMFMVMQYLQLQQQCLLQQQ